MPIKLTGMGEKMRLWKTTVSTRKAMVAQPMMNQMKKAAVGRCDGAVYIERRRIAGRAAK